MTEPTVTEPFPGAADIARRATDLYRAAVQVPAPAAAAPALPFPGPVRTFPLV
jgi:hypothetical protein